MIFNDDDAVVVAVVPAVFDVVRVVVVMLVEKVLGRVVDCEEMAGVTSPESDVDCVVDDNDGMAANDDNGEDADGVCDAGELVEDFVTPTGLDVEDGRLVTG